MYFFTNAGSQSKTYLALELLNWLTVVVTEDSDSSEIIIWWYNDLTS